MRCLELDTPDWSTTTTPRLGWTEQKRDQDDKTTCSWIFNKFNSAINQTVIIIVIILCVSPSHDPNHRLVNIFCLFLL